MLLTDKRIVITGGTGSLGRALVAQLLSGALGAPRAVVVFSRDEAKQHEMRLEHLRLTAATDEVIYAQHALRFVIGDVRDYATVCSVLRDTDVVVNAAAMKQVPTCEYVPYEAIRTNVIGTQNIIRAIQECSLPVEVVVGVSTDKAVKPINVYGMTKALQERLLCAANLSCPATRFACMRYGNVLCSRGSVVPLFNDQIRRGGPVTITSPEMTRFLLSLDQAVDTVLHVISEAKAGEIWVRQVPSARMTDLASVMIGNKDIRLATTGIRPGEKTHEVLISEAELDRTRTEGEYYVVDPMLPELRHKAQKTSKLNTEYSSARDPVSAEDLRRLLVREGVVPCEL